MSRTEVGKYGILRLRLVLALEAQRPILAQDHNAAEATSKVKMV